MDGPGKHYAKWSKPGGERQIPYDLTFNRNLINKTNEQAKYNQRYWNWEQADSDQRGEGREFQGKRLKGGRNNGKGHMDNNRGGGGNGREVGRAEVLGWGGGGKAENCTWTTIIKKKRKQEEIFVILSKAKCFRYNINSTRMKLIN